MSQSTVQNCWKTTWLHLIPKVVHQHGTDMITFHLILWVSSFLDRLLQTRFAVHVLAFLACGVTSPRYYYKTKHSLSDSSTGFVTFKLWVIRVHTISVNRAIKVCKIEPFSSLPIHQIKSVKYTDSLHVQANISAFVLVTKMFWSPTHC